MGLKIAAGIGYTLALVAVFIMGMATMGVLVSSGVAHQYIKVDCKLIK